MIAHYDDVMSALKDKNLRLAKERATEIADKVVPKTRRRMAGNVFDEQMQPEIWQAAWDGAIEAMGYDNEQFKGIPSTLHGNP